MLKSVMHARDLGYDCTVVQDCTFQKDQEPDPEWGGPAAAGATYADVYTAHRGAGARLAHSYLAAAGVRFLAAWPDSRAASL